MDFNLVVSPLQLQVGGKDPNSTSTWDSAITIGYASASGAFQQASYKTDRGEPVQITQNVVEFRARRTSPTPNTKPRELVSQTCPV